MCDNFTVQTRIRNRKSKIVVVGAGPAGASVSIRLAKNGFDVSLIERERFPRHKLCGEFISPECLAHFANLGVLEPLISAGGERISETVFYAPDGQSIAVPSSWFGGDALSLSRAEMDLQLLRRAATAGVEVLEGASVVGVSIAENKLSGVKIKSNNGGQSEIPADLFIDATGRAGILAKLLEKEIAREERISNPDLRAANGAKVQNSNHKTQNRLVGFKTHLENVSLEKNRCEIYFFPGGYGGLSFVEGNRANHCFLMRADAVKKFNGDASKIVEQVIFQNKRARETMRDAAPVFDWLAVSVDGFGAKNLVPALNLFAVGDAAAFIDPFTGSGMLLALESAEILARAIAENALSPHAIGENYRIAHRRKFQNRLRVCSVLRGAVFVPGLAKFAISALSLSAGARRILARSTRRTFAGAANKP